MANLAAIIANKGTYYQPHLLKSLEGEYDEVLADSLLESYNTPRKVMVDPEHFDLVHEGMQWVVEKRGGTAGRARIEGIEVCGKTGTAQNPHGEDHSVFICFAPKDDPKIAIAVYVENAGAGGLWAAPIASLMVEKYLKGNVNRQSLEQYILDADLMDVQVEE
jgi:penicillin-binding protein 2